MKPFDEITLEFQDWRTLPGVEDPLRHDISAVASLGDTLFMACDETASVERLNLIEPGQYSAHKHFRLADFFDLPDGPSGEMDIEGLDISDGYLWIVGSHSLKRDRPKRDKFGAIVSLERMIEIDRDPNRYFLGCVALKSIANQPPELVAEDKGRRCASIKLKKNKSRLLKWLSDDDHLSTFFGVPSKENGFDIEGLAVKGSRVWLGLRGPVLRGYAVVVELDLKRPKRHKLKARRIEKGRRYRKHLIDTHGLGIRDMCFDGNDLLILTGTPLASDGPCHLLRWRNAVFHTDSGVVAEDLTEHVVEVPYKGPIDHAEGITWLPGDAGGGRRLLVIYDSPDPRRITASPARLIADVVNFESPG